MLDLQEKERIEIDFWQHSDTERPMQESLENLLNKMTDVPVFLERLKPFEKLFAEANSITELGGGQGWASCVIKRKFPHAHVTLTDISPYAIASLPLWEKQFSVTIDHATACRSYELPLDSASQDIIFCFAAAHHFVAHRRTLQEIHRVLKSGGKCFYLHEPSCNNLMYKAAHRRVNRIRPHVPEDVLRYKNIIRLATDAGLQTILHADTSMLKRGPTESLYYWAMGRIKVLQHILPCTRDFEFTKSQAETSITHPGGHNNS